MSSTAPTNNLVRSGIGGAGNYHLITSDMASVSRPSIQVVSKTTGTFTSGIGGAGNTHQLSERAQISLEENLHRERLRQYATPTNYHLGIGGAGNIRSCSFDSSRSSSVASSDVSQSTIKSGASKLKNSIVEHWHRRNERISLYEAWNRKLPAYRSSADKGAAVRVYVSENIQGSQDTLVEKGLGLRGRIISKLVRDASSGVNDIVSEIVPIHIIF